jgi:hypothetical protein
MLKLRSASWSAVLCAAKEKNLAGPAISDKRADKIASPTEVNNFVGASPSPLPHAKLSKSQPKGTRNSVDI